MSSTSLSFSVIPYLPIARPTSHLRMTMNPAIEVERKFLLTPAVKDKLLSIPSPTKTIRFRDQYFEEQLALNNTWLRKRNEEWELKLPVPSTEEDDRSFGATIYREYVGLNDVSEALSKYQKYSTSSLIDFDRQENTRHQLLSCYAVLDTERIQLAMPWTNYSVNITLDECQSPHDDFQCSIGELEVMVDNESKVENATQALEDLVEHLHVRQVEDREGKLIKYIKHHRPVLFRKLVQTLSPR